MAWGTLLQETPLDFASARGVPELLTEVGRRAESKEVETLSQETFKNILKCGVLHKNPVLAAVCKNILDYRIVFMFDEDGK